jgi:short-subunit dehydrogenase
MNFALITGASKGIGKAIAEELVCRVYFDPVSRSEELLRVQSMPEKIIKLRLILPSTCPSQVTKKII